MLRSVCSYRSDTNITTASNATTGNTICSRNRTCTDKTTTSSIVSGCCRENNEIILLTSSNCYIETDILRTKLRRASIPYKEQTVATIEQLQSMLQNGIHFLSVDENSDDESSCIDVKTTGTIVLPGILLNDTWIPYDCPHLIQYTHEYIFVNNVVPNQVSSSTATAVSSSSSTNDTTYKSTPINSYGDDDSTTSSCVSPIHGFDKAINSCSSNSSYYTSSTMDWMKQLYAHRQQEREQTQEVQEDLLAAMIDLHHQEPYQGFSRDPQRLDEVQKFAGKGSTISVYQRQRNVLNKSKKSSSDVTYPQSCSLFLNHIDSLKSLSIQKGIDDDNISIDTVTNNIKNVTNNSGSKSNVFETKGTPVFTEKNCETKSRNVPVSSPLSHEQKQVEAKQSTVSATVVNHVTAKSSYRNCHNDLAESKTKNNTRKSLSHDGIVEISLKTKTQRRFYKNSNTAHYGPETSSGIDYIESLESIFDSKITDFAGESSNSKFCQCANDSNHSLCNGNELKFGGISNIQTNTLIVTKIEDLQNRKRHNGVLHAPTGGTNFTTDDNNFNAIQRLSLKKKNENANSISNYSTTTTRTCTESISNWSSQRDNFDGDDAFDSNIDIEVTLPCSLKFWKSSSSSSSSATPSSTSSWKSSQSYSFVSNNEAASSLSYLGAIIDKVTTKSMVVAKSNTHNSILKESATADKSLKTNGSHVVTVENDSDDNRIASDSPTVFGYEAATDYSHVGSCALYYNDDADCSDDKNVKISRSDAKKEYQELLRSTGGVTRDTEQQNVLLNPTVSKWTQKCDNNVTENTLKSKSITFTDCYDDRKGETSIGAFYYTVNVVTRLSYQLDIIYSLFMRIHDTENKAFLFTTTKEGCEKESKRRRQRQQQLQEQNRENLLSRLLDQFEFDCCELQKCSLMPIRQFLATSIDNHQYHQGIKTRCEMINQYVTFYFNLFHLIVRHGIIHDRTKSPSSPKFLTPASSSIANSSTNCDNSIEYNTAFWSSIGYDIFGTFTTALCVQRHLLEILPLLVANQETAFISTRTIGCSEVRQEIVGTNGKNSHTQIKKVYPRQALESSTKSDKAAFETPTAIISCEKEIKRRKRWQCLFGRRFKTATKAKLNPAIVMETFTGIQTNSTSSMSNVLCQKEKLLACPSPSFTPSTRRTILGMCNCMCTKPSTNAEELDFFNLTDEQNSCNINVSASSNTNDSKGAMSSSSHAHDISSAESIDLRIVFVLAKSLYTDVRTGQTCKQQLNNVSMGTIESNQLSNFLQQISTDYCQNYVEVAIYPQENHEKGFQNFIMLNERSKSDVDEVANAVRVVLPSCLQQYKNHFGDGSIESMLDFMYRFLSTEQKGLLMLTERYMVSSMSCQQQCLSLFIIFDIDIENAQTDISHGFVEEKTIRRRNLPFEEPDLGLRVSNEIKDDGASTVLSLYTTEPSVGFFSNLGFVGGIRYNIPTSSKKKKGRDIHKKALPRKVKPMSIKSGDDIQLSVLFNENSSDEESVNATDAASRNNATASPSSLPVLSKGVRTSDEDRSERWQQMYNIPGLGKSNAQGSDTPRQHLNRSLSLSSLVTDIPPPPLNAFSYLLHRQCSDGESQLSCLPRRRRDSLKFKESFQQSMNTLNNENIIPALPIRNRYSVLNLGKQASLSQSCHHYPSQTLFKEYEIDYVNNDSDSSNDADDDSDPFQEYRPNAVLDDYEFEW